MQDDLLNKSIPNVIDRLKSGMFPEKDVGSAIFMAGGGQDSAASLWAFLENMPLENIVIYPLFFNYGQATFLPELECVKMQIEVLKNEYALAVREGRLTFAPIIEMDDPLMKFLKDADHFMVTGVGHTPGSHCVEYRNMRYFAIAAGLAANFKAKYIIAGIAPATIADNGFAATAATQAALDQNVNDKSLAVRIFTPFIWSHRAATIDYMARRVPEEYMQASYSCYSPVFEHLQDSGMMAYTHCGKCVSCGVRAAGHNLSGYPDPGNAILVPTLELMKRKMAEPPKNEFLYEDIDEATKADEERIDSAIVDFDEVIEEVVASLPKGLNRFDAALDIMIKEQMGLSQRLMGRDSSNLFPPMTDKYVAQKN